MADEDRLRVAELVQNRKQVVHREWDRRLALLFGRGERSVPLGLPGRWDAENLPPLVVTARARGRPTSPRGIAGLRPGSSDQTTEDRRQHHAGTDVIDMIEEVGSPERAEA
jgi:hypothetical protein